MLTDIFSQWQVYSYSIHLVSETTWEKKTVSDLVSSHFMVISLWRLLWQHISLFDSEEMQLMEEGTVEGWVPYIHHLLLLLLWALHECKRKIKRRKKKEKKNILSHRKVTLHLLHLFSFYGDLGIVIFCLTFIFNQNWLIYIMFE